MSKIPDPRHTPAGPMYEGRLLDRVDEEVVDQGVAFDLGTLLSRRSMMGIFGVGAGALALAACSNGVTEATPMQSASPSLGASSGTSMAPTTAAAPSASSAPTAETVGEVPDETAGPYPGDGSNGPDVLENAGIVRSDLRSSIGGGMTAVGVPMTLTLTLQDIANGNKPFANAAVYVWHCDASGAYSMYSAGIENESYLRGVQVADPDGRVKYTSIFPACYTGRWPHIHFEVYSAVGDITDSTQAISTSQIALPQNVSEAVYASSDYEGSAENLSQVSLGTDNVFSDDSAALQLATVTGDPTAGFHVELTVGVDTATTPSAGAPPAGGMGGQGGPGGNPPQGAPPVG